MKKALALFLVILGAKMHAQQLSKADEFFIDSLMNANYKSSEPGATILIAKKGIPIYKKAYGLANVELNIPNKTEYVFKIGSMSKQFTAVCVLKLAQEGKLNLQDNIKKYLPNYNIHGRLITIENILNHTSGITSYTEKPDFDSKAMQDASIDEMKNFFMNDSLFFEPGTDWSYSNSGYLLAGLIVEKVSGKSLSEYLQENIFTPLQMSHTFIGNYNAVIPNAVSGYDFVETGKFKPAAYMSWSWPYAAGNILSSIDDLLKWDNALYSEKIIKKEWLEKAWKSFHLPNGQQTNYGFGWTVNNYQGIEFITHGGGINGFLSDGIRIPYEQLYIVTLSNSTAKRPNLYTTSIALRLIKKEYTKPSVKRIDKKVLEEYTGVYKIHRNGMRVSINFTTEELYRYITMKNDTLFAQQKGSGKISLLNSSKDVFITKDHNPKYHFHRDEKGKVISLEIYNEPIQYGTSEVEAKTNIPLPKEKKAVEITLKKLDELKGKYDFGDGYYIDVFIENNKLFVQGTGETKEQVFAENETHFFFKSIDATIEFKKEKDKVIGLLLDQGGEFEAKKME